jgi:hypothetical protein
VAPSGFPVREWHSKQRLSTFLLLGIHLIRRDCQVVRCCRASRVLRNNTARAGAKHAQSKSSLRFRVSHQSSTQSCGGPGMPTSCAYRPRLIPSICMNGIASLLPLIWKRPRVTPRVKNSNFRIPSPSTMSPENGIVLMKLGLASWRRLPRSGPSGVVHRRPDIALEYVS